VLYKKITRAFLSKKEDKDFLLLNNKGDYLLWKN